MALVHAGKIWRALAAHEREGSRRAERIATTATCFEAWHGTTFAGRARLVARRFIVVEVVRDARIDDPA